MSACEGQLADDFERPRDPACSTLRPGPAPLRRLTRFEYDNTVRDLLGDGTRPARRLFPVEEIGNGFGNDANAMSISPSLARAYHEVARAEATMLLADAARLGEFLRCDPSLEGELACAHGFIGRFAGRAFRRPVTDEEAVLLSSLFTRVRALPQQTFHGALGAVVEATLQLPGFLYRAEWGTGPVSEGIVRVQGYEMASRLSYLLWGSMPDDELLAAAAEGRLRRPEQVRDQAWRMVDDPRARALVRFFNANQFQLEGVGGLTRDPALYPDFTEELPGLLQEETAIFLDDVIWSGPGDLHTILTANHSFMNARLAAYYGIQSGPVTSQFERVDLEPTRAAGVLTQGGLMASLTPGNSHTNPVVRGKYVLTRLLCRTPPSPPSGFAPMLPMVDLTLTTRQRFAAHSASTACSGCHQLLDPLGFAFEHYDPAGRWRDLDNGQPVDATGTITFAGSPLDGPFDGASELAEKLAVSTEVRDCWVGRWVTFAYGRAEVEADACSRLVVQQAFDRSKGNVRAMLVALTQTDAFLYRPEVTP